MTETLVVLNPISGVGRAAKHCTKGIAPSLEDLPMGCTDGVLHQRVVSSERHAHGVGLGLPEPGAAFDVGEKKRHHSGGQSLSPLNRYHL